MSPNSKDYKLLIEEENVNNTSTSQPSLITMKDNLSYVTSSAAATGVLPVLTYCAAKVIWFEGKISRLTMTSFLFMVLSSIIAAWSDISTTFSFSEASYTSLNLGYFWMGINCFSSAAYVLTMRKYIKSIGFKDFDTVYYNNLLSIPLLIILSFTIEDWGVGNLEKNFPIEVRNTLVMAILFSGISAFAISYASAWCVRVTSSTTYSMVGALNKLPVAASGMIFFNDPVTFGSVSAITVAKSGQAIPDKQNSDDYLPKPVSSQYNEC
ncbi:20130_t:CDS:2 [Gigaspora margarita]|uniref:GDP-mannose transporter n=1 Tax=Gigaspora margarita TaxID=4874 RepID=A0ABN7V2P2_GIGMA|nr:20130_t:CDS:2 [Gigaspora margarita]